MHVELADHHSAAGLAGDGAWFGIGAAVLAGDLAFVWADELFVSEKTVKTHVSSVLSKLRLTDRTQAALLAVRTGVVDPRT